jgi:hypothetical protein
MQLWGFLVVLGLTALCLAACCCRPKESVPARVRQAYADAVASRVLPPPLPPGVGILDARRYARVARRADLRESHLQRGFDVTLLERAAVAQSTNTQYDARNRVFIEFCLETQQPMSCPAEVDSALVEFLEILFFEGEHASVGRQTLAAWLHAFPQFGSRGSFDLPRSWRAVAGWEKLDPAWPRVPATWEHVCGVAARMAFHGQRNMAVLTLTAFDIYSRPSEILRITPADVTAPVPNSVFTTASVRLNSRAAGVPSKTNTFDDTVAVSERRRAVSQLLLDETQNARALKQDRVFPHSQASWNAMLKKCSEELGLPAITGYNMRHGGASADAAAGDSLDEVQRRGRWKAASSCKRYEKRGLLQEALSQMPTQVRMWCTVVTQNVDHYIRAPHQLPPISN